MGGMSVTVSSIKLDIMREYRRDEMKRAAFDIIMLSLVR